MSGIASEAGAVRHTAHLSQAQRNNIASPDPGDQSPFEALLDDTGDAPPVPKMAPSSAPPNAAPKLAARPQDNPSPPSSAPANSGDPPPSTPPGAGVDQQAANGPPAASSDTSKGPDIIDAALAALAGKSTNSDNSGAGNVLPDTTASGNGTGEGIASEDPIAASTAADISGNPTKPGSKSDSKSDPKSDSKTAEDTPPLNAVTNQQPNMPVAAVLSLSLTAPPTPTGPNASDDQDVGTVASDSGASSPAGQMAALGDALTAAPRGKADRGGPASVDAASAPSATDRTKAGPSGYDTPAPPPAAPQVKPASAAGGAPPDGGDATPSRDQAAVSATAAAADHARALAAIGQTTEGTAESQNNASGNSISATEPDPDSGVPASTQRLEIIDRQSLETSGHRIDTLPESGTAQAGSGQAGGLSPLPGGASGAVAPALLTASAIQTSTPVTSANPPAVPIAGLAIEIVSHFNAGSNRFDIRLDPPELGRINVRLDVDRDGKVTSRVVADRPETLDILQRNASELERTLQQSGLKTADNGLQFSLRDQGGFNAFTGQNPYPQNGSSAGTTRLIVPDRDLASIDGVATGYGRASAARTGIDIRV